MRRSLRNLPAMQNPDPSDYFDTRPNVVTDAYPEGTQRTEGTGFAQLERTFRKPPLPSFEDAIDPNSSYNNTKPNTEPYVFLADREIKSARMAATAHRLMGGGYGNTGGPSGSSSRPTGAINDTAQSNFGDGEIAER